MTFPQKIECDGIPVLIVEDSLTQAEQLRYLLEQQHYAVAVAHDGRQALMAVRRHKPALIISDIIMPEMDGYQLCRAIKADQALKDIPIILVTSLSSLQDVVKGLECGADHFIRKPYEQKYLLSRIQYLLMNQELRRNQKVRLGMEVYLSGQRHFITAERQQILDLLISTYEEAIRINEELEMRQQELIYSNHTLNGLYAMAENLNRAASEQEVVERSVACAMELPGIQACWIYLREGSNAFRLAAALPPSLNLADAPASCLCQQTLMGGEFIAAINVDRCERLPEGDRACTHGAVPLWAGNNRLGVMNLTKENRRPFSAAERRTLLGIGNQIAVALMRARLHDHLESLVAQRTAALTAEIAEHQRTEAALRASEARFSGILDIAHDAIISVDRAQRILLFNKGAETIFGYKAGELIGKPLDLLLPEALRERHRRHVQGFGLSSHKARRMGENLEVFGLRKNGQAFPAEASISKLEIGGETVFTTVLRDITERKEQEAKILRLNRVYAVLSEINMAIVHIRERSALFDEVCRIALEQGRFKMIWIGLVDEKTQRLKSAAWAGMDREFLDALCVVIGPEAPEDQHLLSKALREKKPVICNDVTSDPLLAPWREETLKRGCYACAGFPLLTGKQVKGIILLYAQEINYFNQDERLLLEEMAGDVAYALENIEKAEQLNYLAYYDAVTGLPNRLHFVSDLEQRLTWARQEKKQMALMVLDLERFKLINDSLGYGFGDRLLRQVAERLKIALQDEELLARSGSDEFAIALSQVDEEAAVLKTVNERVFAALSEPFDINGRYLRITAKVGAALFPNDAEDAEALFRNAEAALIKAKQSSEKFLFYALDMNARVSEILAMENKLIRAIENQEFILYYQPKLDLASSRICGLEALIRWQDPDRGLVPPAHFIPLLEENGMILEVGRWALETAAKQQRQWLDKGYMPVPIAVNVSCIQLRNGKFVQEVEEILRHYGVQKGIELEITESVIMESVERNVKILKLLRDKGVYAAIDDFGTGYSSLSYLIRLPTNRLKIDKAFITDMAQNSDSLAVVSSIISLAHTLNLKVIAEGVENEEQLKLLKRLGCDEIQGYLYSYPLPPEEIETLLTQRAVKDCL